MPIEGPPVLETEESDPNKNKHGLNGRFFRGGKWPDIPDVETSGDPEGSVTAESRPEPRPSPVSAEDLATVLLTSGAHRLSPYRVLEPIRNREYNQSQTRAFEWIEQNCPAGEKLSSLDTIILNSDRERDYRAFFQDENLAEIETLPSDERIKFLAGASMQMEIGSADFDRYFNRFPEDAKLVIRRVYDAYSPEFDHSMYEIIQPEFGAKVFGTAIKHCGFMNILDSLDRTESAYVADGTEREAFLTEAHDFLKATEIANHLDRFFLGDRNTTFEGVVLKYREPGEQIISARNSASKLKYSEAYEVYNDTTNAIRSVINLPDERFPKIQKVALLKELLFYSHNSCVEWEISSIRHAACLKQYEKEEKSYSWSEYYTHSIIAEIEHPAVLYELPYTFSNSEDSGDSLSNCYDEFMIRELLEQLAKLDSRESIPPTLEFWRKNGNPLYGPAVAEVLNIDPSASAREILSQLPVASEAQRRGLISLLYRLEIGKVGISPEGLDYLGRRFDLDQYNDPANFAHRLTADGKVGIFDADRQLRGFIQLEANDFAENDDEPIRKAILNITLEMLFVPHPDEQESDRRQREKLLIDFRANYFDTYLNLFQNKEGETGLRFNNLTLPEQGFVSHFIDENKNNPDLKDRFFKFISKFGEDGFLAFRSIEFDPTAGDQLIELGERVDTAEMKALFREYSTTYQLAEAVSRHIGLMLQNQANDLEINLIRENILMSAQKVLLNPEPDDENLAGRENLIFINQELNMILGLPPTKEGFIDGQVFMGRYLKDNIKSTGGNAEYLVASIINGYLRRLYNNESFDLREYEDKTTDTAQTLDHALEVIEDDPYLRVTSDNDFLTIINYGAGGARDSIPFALLGHKVNGIDISARMVAQGQERVMEFQSMAANGTVDPYKQQIDQVIADHNLSYGPEDVAALSQRIDIREGNFSTFSGEQYKKTFGEPADAAMMMWHTFGFAGDHDGQRQALTNIYDSLRPGGMVIIEMPDRNFGQYARMIRKYHAEHPSEPFGAVVDAPSSQPGQVTEQNSANLSPRYFPSREEIETVLQESGFEIEHVRTYFVRNEDNLVIKENMYVARKRLDQRRFKKLTDWVGSMPPDTVKNQTPQSGQPEVIV